MYRLSQKHDQQWGIEGYEVPSKHLDHIRIAAAKMYYKYATNEVKRPKQKEVDAKAQRGGFTKEIEKTAVVNPEPWKYDLRQRWLTGFRGGHVKESVSQNRQKMTFKWLGTPNEKQEIEKFERSRSAQPDMSCTKFTYIDKIISDNCKENYPRPGPGNYFMDEKSAKRFYKDDPESVMLREAEGKEENKDRFS